MRDQSPTDDVPTLAELAELAELEASTATPDEPTAAAELTQRDEADGDFATFNAAI